MTSLKQIEANRLNARKSTGPRTEEGKRQSRRNSLRHGLTAETVIPWIEEATDYRTFESTIVADYQPRTATERELVFRLASLLWRLRRSTSIETGLFQIQAELMQGQSTAPRRYGASRPHWYDELDVIPATDGYSIAPVDGDTPPTTSSDTPQALAYCFHRVSGLRYGTFRLLNRYESALWRQVAQILVLLETAFCR
jgi:hypothetical protein